MIGLTLLAFQRTFRHEAHARGRRKYTQNSRFAIAYDIKMHFGGKNFLPPVRGPKQ